MKKIKIVSLLSMLFVSFLMLIQGAYAAEITDLKYKNNRISLSGVGDTQVQIVLFGLDSSPLYMTTAAVENGEFSIMLPKIDDLKDGNYTVKVADYNGKNIDSKKLIIKSNTKKDKKVPVYSRKTGEESLMYLVTILLEIVSGLSLVFLSIRKNAKKACKH